MNAEARRTGGSDGLAAGQAEGIVRRFEAPGSERHVVGAALLGSLAGVEALDVDRDVADPRLRAVGHAVLELAGDGPLDPAAVLAVMQRSPDVRWTLPGGVAVFLAELVDPDTVPIPAQATWHAAVVRECTARRELHALGDLAHRLAGESIHDVIVPTRTLVDAVLGVAEALKRVTS